MRPSSPGSEARIRSEVTSSSMACRSAYRRTASSARWRSLISKGTRLSSCSDMVISLASAAINDCDEETELVDLDAAVVPSFRLQRKVEAKPTRRLGGGQRLCDKVMRRPTG